jgi:hypothetical protein
MKKPKSNKTPDVKPVDEKPIEPPPGWLPTTEHLAMIAATLASSTNENPAILVDAALKIWRSAVVTLQTERMFPCMWQKPPKIFTIKDRDEDGKISRDTFFKRVLPHSKKNRTYDRARIGKVFIRKLFCDEFRKEPTEKEFADFYAKWNVGGRVDADQLALRFEWWYHQYVKESRRAAGMMSAQAKQGRKKKRKARPPREKLKEIVRNLDDAPLT